jgi:nucleotide-binding universal stress UspA family protein
MSTTILVGVDDSDRSLDAIAFARQVAGASGASVLVAPVFPYEDHPTLMGNAAFGKFLESDALALVHRLGAELTDLGEGRVRTAVVARHSTAHGLHDLAEAERPDLVVVGSSHVGTAGRVTPGSTGERLLHGICCPVVIVPKGYRTSQPQLRRIGVAYNGSPEAGTALQAGIEVARATGARLEVIRAFDAVALGTPTLMAAPSTIVLQPDREEKARKMLDEVVSELPADIDAAGVFLTGEPARELADRTPALDLLITGSRGYGPLRAVLTGGVTGRVLRESACPVVVLPRGVDSPLGELFAGRGVSPEVA